jgi:hypothetical protein
MAHYRLICLFLLVTTLATHAQEPVEREYRNEINVDVTALLRQFLFSGDQLYPAEYPFPYSTPFYQIGYRRHLNKMNLRAGFGMAYSVTDEPNFAYPEHDRTRREAQQINGRLGVEWVQELHRRWQVFYGVDALITTAHTFNGVTYYNGPYGHGYERSSVAWGAGGVLGFRYRITPRLSLFTETSLTYFRQEEKQRTFRFPRDPEDPSSPPPEDRTGITDRSFTLYQLPLSVMVAFDF